MVKRTLFQEQIFRDNPVESIFSCMLENAWLYCGLSAILAKQPSIIRGNKKEGIRYGAETLFKSE